MRLVADLHTHTIASGHAYSTIKEIAEAAQQKGLELVAITDHGPNEPGAPHWYYFDNLPVVPKRIAGVEVLKGVEANIIGWEGELDLDLETLSRLDLVAAGFHTRETGSVEENTHTMIKAMAGGLVDIIVHPGNPRFAIDPVRVVEAAQKYGVVLEINNSSLTAGSFRRGSRGNCLKIARLAAEAGITVVVGSDAHWAEDVGEFGLALELLLEAGVKPEQVLNTSVEKIKSYLEKRGQLRRQALADVENGQA